MASKLATVFFLLSVCSVIHAKHILGGQSCTWGPSYWCQSAKTAVECDALDHCMKNVWSKKLKSNGIECDLCESAVSNFIKHANSSGAQKEIAQLLNGLCTAIGGEAEKGCKTFATKYVPPFIQYALKMLKPKQLCTLVNLCSASSSEGLINLQNLLAPGAIRNILTSGKIESILAPGAVRNVKTSPGIESILAPGAARNVKKQPSIESILAPGAQRNVKVPASIENILAPGAVRNVKLPAKTQAASSDSLECIACSVIVSELDSALGNKNTENKIISYADSLCKYLPGDLSTECQSYINQFGPPILQALLQYLPADQVCAYYLKLCPKSVLTNDDVRVPAPTQLVSGLCVFCETGVTYIEGLLKINKTETEIYDALVNLCTVVPTGVLRTDCDNFVEKYAKAAIKLVNSDIAPSSVCKLLGICNSSEMATKKLNVCRMGPKFWCGTKTAAVYCKKQRQCASTTLTASTSVHTAFEATEVCSFCETIVDYVEGLIKINQTENTIYNDLATLCYIFPSGSMRTDCVSFVDKYTKSVFQLVNSSVKPSSVCKLLGACSSSQVAVRKMNLCLLGSEFWCRNKVAASQCKRRSYCRL
ncbi:expressed hypothetical protein [Trichoplax adhaerens]|uniref:Prosaposin n=1 Tax=Trichoplax adhaerens TaxID=10228 RepID=B3SAT1_TRIAD|nr:expressed hypothetical protein [Trichoplax adhaerens]EDV20160.1 expressed hypothetical protein [Trichoplax adhaerens]|eukprot:XP_002117321.1 expressed hypothetical protein [Trichoplax adhaerens]